MLMKLQLPVSCSLKPSSYWTTPNSSTAFHVYYSVQFQPVSPQTLGRPPCVLQCVYTTLLFLGAKQRSDLHHSHLLRRARGLCVSFLALVETLMFFFVPPPPCPPLLHVFLPLLTHSLTFCSLPVLPPLFTSSSLPSYIPNLLCFLIFCFNLLP